MVTAEALPEINHTQSEASMVNGDETTSAEAFSEIDHTQSNASMVNGAETTSENTEIKMDHIFQNPETEAVLNATPQPHDTLTLFFKSIESHTRNLPIHLRLVAKRKISDIIFDLEENHISEMNLWR